MENISPQLRRDVEAAETLMDDVSQNDEKMYMVTITMVQMADSIQKPERSYNMACSIATAQTCELIQTYMKLKDDILICDPEGEYGPLVNKLKGQIIHLSQASRDFAGAFSCGKTGCYLIKYYGLYIKDWGTF